MANPLPKSYEYIACEHRRQASRCDYDKRFVLQTSGPGGNCRAVSPVSRPRRLGGLRPFFRLCGLSLLGGPGNRRPRGPQDAEKQGRGLMANPLPKSYEYIACEHRRQASRCDYDKRFVLQTSGPGGNCRAVSPVSRPRPASLAGTIRWVISATIPPSPIPVRQSRPEYGNAERNEPRCRY
jgi:hypothetical protein